jgi:uncharacterized DUF497 family protein
MKWGWDPEKSRRNLQKHRVPFDLAPEMFEGAVYEANDDRMDYGEDRTIAIGMVEGRFLVCVYTVRDDEYRVISLRKATKRERERYVEEIFS